MAKIVLVGLDNPQSRDPRHALYPWPPGCAGHRLQSKFSGLRRREFMEFFERDNLFPYCPAYGGILQAREHADMVFERHPDARKFVVFGSQVARAMLSEWDDYFRWYEAYPEEGRTVRVAVCPHPSGRNRWFNDLANEVRMKTFFSRLTEDRR